MIDDIDHVGMKRHGGGNLSKVDEPPVGYKKGDQVGLKTSRKKSTKKVQNRQGQLHSL